MKVQLRFSHKFKISCYKSSEQAEPSYGHYIDRNIARNSTKRILVILQSNGKIQFAPWWAEMEAADLDV